MPRVIIYLLETKEKQKWNKYTVAIGTNLFFWSWCVDLIVLVFRFFDSYNKLLKFANEKERQKTNETNVKNLHEEIHLDNFTLDS